MALSLQQMVDRATAKGTKLLLPSIGRNRGKENFAAMTRRRGAANDQGEHDLIDGEDRTDAQIERERNADAEEAAE